MSKKITEKVVVFVHFTSTTLKRTGHRCYTIESDGSIEFYENLPGKITEVLEDDATVGLNSPILTSVNILSRVPVNEIETKEQREETLGLVFNQIATDVGFKDFTAIESLLAEVSIDSLRDYLSEGSL